MTDTARKKTDSGEKDPQKITTELTRASETDARKRSDLLKAQKEAKPPTETYTYRATGLVLRMLEAMIGSTIRVDGVHNIKPGPVLFVSNHFTRFETFILPYVLNKYTGRFVRSLAHYKLFNGSFGNYLSIMGAVSTKAPDVKHTMVEELLTGRNDWVIYPEGSMIKDKSIWSKGKFLINSPDRTGPPHTGAAVIALQAEMYKQYYLRACRKGDTETMKQYEERFHFAGETSLPKEPLQVIPVNITYYPVRPSKNLVYRMAQFLFKKLPEGLAEELEVEGTLLLADTDISFYFGKAIMLEEYLKPLTPFVRALTPFSDDQRRVDIVLEWMKTRLTNRFMAAIYDRTTVNIDHLFCSALRYANRERIDCDDFHLAIYLAAREIQARGSRVRHPSIDKGLIEMVVGDPYAPLESIRKLCLEAGVLSIEDGTYVINAAALAETYQFQNVRVKNTPRVIANEMEPCREVIKTVTSVVNQSKSQLRARSAEVLMKEDIDEFEADYASCAGATGLKSADVGRPFFLQRSNAKAGIVLSHGYLGAASEIRPLAEYLYGLGFSVYGVRLKGHGTIPEHLSTVKWEEWLRSYYRAYAVVRSACKRVVLGGFSTGGLLALLAAARHQSVDAVFSINAPLGLMDRKSALVPVVQHWNHLLEKLRINKGRLEAVANHPENPDINYHSNPINGIHQLEMLIDQTRKELPALHKPALIVQGDNDPVVTPKSGQQIHDLIRSEEKDLARMEFKRHVIVRGEGCELVWHRIGDFVIDRANRMRSGA